MGVRLISVCSLFLGCHGLSLSAGGSPPAPSRNDDLWDSINQVVDSMEPPETFRALRRSWLAERPRRRRRRNDSKVADGAAAPANETGTGAGVPANRTAAAVKSAAGAASNATTELPRILFGSHHQAGVRLLQSMQTDFVITMKVRRAEISACPNFTSVGAGHVVRPCQLNLRLYKEFMELPGRKKIVHVTRDPLKFLVAAYVYHCFYDDSIFSEVASAEELASMPAKAGVELFAKFAIEHWLKDMVYVNNAIQADGAEAYTVRLEDLSGPEELFNAASFGIFKFLADGDDGAAATMLETATNFHLFNRTKEFVKQATLSVPERAHDAYVHISQLPNNILKFLLEGRYQLGYDID